MAWSMPRAWIPGELVDASLMNTYLRDQLAYAIPNVSPQDVPYSGSNFVGQGGMTWTVQSGDVEWFWLYRTGSRLVASVGVLNTSISGTPSNRVDVIFPGLLFTQGSTVVRSGRFVDNGTVRSLLVQTTGDRAACQHVTGNFAASTNNTILQFTIEVMGGF